MIKPNGMGNDRRGESITRIRMGRCFHPAFLYSYLWLVNLTIPFAGIDQLGRGDVCLKVRQLATHRGEIRSVFVNLTEPLKIVFVVLSFS